MDRLSIYDAKARFSELVERAQGGRSTVITKRGRIVAKIVPAKASGWDRSAVLDEAESLRRSLIALLRRKPLTPIDAKPLCGAVLGRLRQGHTCEISGIA